MFHASHCCSGRSLILSQEKKLGVLVLSLLGEGTHAVGDPGKPGLDPSCTRALTAQTRPTVPSGLSLNTLLFFSLLNFIVSVALPSRAL